MEYPKRTLTRQAFSSQMDLVDDVHRELQNHPTKYNGYSRRPQMASSINTPRGYYHRVGADYGVTRAMPSMGPSSIGPGPAGPSPSTGKTPLNTNIIPVTNISMGVDAGYYPMRSTIRPPPSVFDSAPVQFTSTVDDLSSLLDHWKPDIKLSTASSSVSSNGNSIWGTSSTSNDTTVWG